MDVMDEPDDEPVFTHFQSRPLGALERDGATPVGTTPAEFGAILAREVEKYARLVKLSGAKPE
jgi:hypothetical protein